MAVLTFLREVRALLEDPAHWIADAGAHTAVDANGSGCSPIVSWAVRFELLGAIGRVDGSARDRQVAQVRIADQIQHGAPSAFHVLADWHAAPGRTHAEVLERLDLAIRAEEELQARRVEAEA